MNLNVLGISVMVLITREWLANPVIVAEINKHPLGAAIWNELARIHKLVSEFRQQRMALEATLAELTEQITHNSDLHDRKARALRNLLLFTAEATNNPSLARKLRELEALLFPDQLRILHMSYFEKAGAIIELEQRVTPAALRTLESQRVSDQTLADIYGEWVAAGHALGRDAQQRARVEASLSAHGSAAPQTRARKVRSAWIRGVRLLLDTLDILELSSTTRERLLAPLQKGVRDASLRRNQNSEPATPPVARPRIELHAEPAIEPPAEPPPELHARPEGKPAAEPPAEPAIELHAKPAIVPPGEPAIEPPAEPAIELHAGLHIEPRAGLYIEPGGEPDVQPGIGTSIAHGTRPRILPMIDSGILPKETMRAGPRPRPPTAGSAPGVMTDAD